MQIRPSTILFLSFVLFNIQCTKKESDTSTPNISLISPKNNDTVYASLSEIPIEFIATDNDRLDEMEMNIYDSIHKNIAQEKTSIFGSSFHYTSAMSFQSSSSKRKEFQLEIKIKDKSGNLQTSNTKFYIVPKS